MKLHFNRTRDGEVKIKPFGAASHNLLLLGVLAIFLAAGCSSVGKLLPSGGGSGVNQAPDTSKPSASPVERRLALEQPRTMNYADLQFKLTKAVISGRVAEDLPIDNSKPEIADVTFSVVNTLKNGVGIDNGMWQLRLGDGSVYKQIYSDNIAPRDTKERKISFRVPVNSQWNGAQITLDEQDKEPATLVLDGPISTPQYPINITTGDSETSTKTEKLTYQIIKATLDMDAFGKRAALGKRYLNLTVRIKDKGASSGGGYFVPEYFRLLVDGTPSSPENASDPVLDSGGSQDYSMSYVVSANVVNVELEVGKPGVSELAKIPIDFRKTMP